MLQRSPSYVLTLPAVDAVAERLRRHLPARHAYAVTRWKNVAVTTAFYQLCRARPSLAKRLLRKGVAAQLPDDFDVDTHFGPAYDPWDQRLCFVPDGDLFAAIRSGAVEMVTDHVDRFTPTGVRLRSGRELDAEVVVGATGLALLAFGGIELVVDGEPVRPAGHAGLQGDDALRCAQLRLRDRLHQRVVDVEGRPGERVRLPAARPPRRARATTSWCRCDPRAWRSGRSWTSRPATCSVPCTCCPSRGPEPPWRLRMNYIRDVRDHPAVRGRRRRPGVRLRVPRGVVRRSRRPDDVSA